MKKKNNKEMKHENEFSPSVVCGLLHKIGEDKKFEEFIGNKYGIKLRKLSFYDLQIPMDTERYNKSMNLIKPFVSGMLQRGFTLLPFRKWINKLLNRKGFSFPEDKILNYPKEPNHKLKSCGFCPLFFDYKYINHIEQGKPAFTKEEKKNVKRFLKFESDNYKIRVMNKETDVSLIINSEDLK